MPVLSSNPITVAFDVDGTQKKRKPEHTNIHSFFIWQSPYELERLAIITIPSSVSYASDKVLRCQKQRRPNLRGYSMRNLLFGGKVWENVDLSTFHAGG